MEVTFWGVRGSIPAPGPETNRYGGNTACISIRTKEGNLVILDMGTGIVNLGRSLMQTEFGAGKGSATVLLSHAHWDHIQGFAFFAPIFVPGNRFQIHGQARSSSMLEGILEGQMNPHFSPIYTLKNLGATIEILAVPAEVSFEVMGLHVRGLANPHGATTVLAYRLEEGSRSIVYATDAGYPDDGPSAAMLELYRDADLLIHDSSYTPEDQAARISRGCSSYVDAAKAAARANARHLMLFHYDQDYSDDVVDQLAIRCRHALDANGGSACKLTAACEGLTMVV
ncbi:MAG: MBL fold metallo-hydrolase [Pseudomonadota bacterium]